MNLYVVPSQKDVVVKLYIHEVDDVCVPDEQVPENMAGNTTAIIKKRMPGSAWRDDAVDIPSII